VNFLHNAIHGKVLLDMAALILMLISMDYRVVGDTFHEATGVIITVFFLFHNFWNRQWYAAVFQGKYDICRGLRTAVNLLLLLAMLLLIISAVPIAHVIVSAIPVPVRITMQEIHVLSAYWSFILIAVHLGMHGVMLRRVLKKTLGISGGKRVGKTVWHIFFVGVVVYGIQASFAREISSHLFLQYTADFWSTDSSLGKFFLDYAAILGMYSCITYSIMKILQN
jgi:hypothetical protein